MNTDAATISILIVEDHELARGGLKFALNNAGGLKVVGEAENGEEGVRLAEETRPDVVLMDLGMPVMDGIEATRLIKERFPDIKVLMLTSHQDGEEVYAALAAGADAYCMKEIKTERLIQVLQMVIEGAIWLDPAIARRIMDSLTVKPAQKSPQVRKQYNVSLTDREKEVLSLIVEGKSNKEIATVLAITIHTAKAHVATIIQKLSVDDRTQAAVKALRDGLIHISR